MFYFNVLLDQTGSNVEKKSIDQIDLTKSEVDEKSHLKLSKKHQQTQPMQKNQTKLCNH